MDNKKMKFDPFFTSFINNNNINININDKDNKKIKILNNKDIWPYFKNYFLSKKNIYDDIFIDENTKSISIFFNNYENANKFSNSGYTDMMIFFRSELQKENKDPKKFTFNFEYTNNHQDKTKVVKIQLV